MYKLFASLIFVSTFFRVHGADENIPNILVDLGVVLKLDEQAHAPNIGLPNIAKYVLARRNPLDLPDRFMDILDLAGKQDDIPAEEQQRNENGRIFPRVICDLRTGQITPQQALDKFHELLAESHREEPTSPTHTDAVDKNMLERVANCAFNPQLHVDALKPVSAAIKLLRNIKANVALAVTLDPATFEALYAHEKYTMFQQTPVVVTGYLNSAPPQTAFFTGALDHLRWTKKDCIYISPCDSETAGAQRFGLKTVKWEDGLTAKDLLPAR